MNKKFAIISLAIIAVIGSIWTFYASNLFFSDVSNFGAGFMSTTLFVTLPALTLGAMLVASTLFIVRFYQRPNSRKVLARNYLFIAMALAVFGAFFTVLGAVLNMDGSFIKPYPFAGYLIIMLVLHLLILIGAALTLFLLVLKRMPDDTEKFKVSVKHVFHTIGLFLLIAMAFNRFGAFLLMPVYVQTSTFYKTFVYYLFLLIPMALLVCKVVDIFMLRHNMFIYVLSVAIANLALMILILVLGSGDASFISAVSAAAPLERLGSMPMEIFIHFFTYFGVSIYYILIERIKFNAVKKAQE